MTVPLPGSGTADAAVIGRVMESASSCVRREGVELVSHCGLLRATRAPLSLSHGPWGCHSDGMRKHDRGLLLTLSNTLEVPQDRVFRALTDPAELAKWWGPHGFTMPQAELDLRVGGNYRFFMQPPEGELFHLSGDFLEIDPPMRLVYTFRWEEPTADDQETVVTLSLRVRGGVTEVSLSQGPFATEGRLELHRRGWTDSFQRLRGFLGSNS